MLMMKKNRTNPPGSTIEIPYLTNPKLLYVYNVSSLFMLASRLHNELHVPE